MHPCRRLSRGACEHPPSPSARSRGSTAHKRRTDDPNVAAPRLLHEGLWWTGQAAALGTPAVRRAR
eukprot:scaffold8199_cov112-Isochrysis_galbana.AAC.2